MSFEISRNFAAGSIDFVEYMDENVQTGLGLGLGQQLHDAFQRCENDTLTCPRDVREEAVFDRVVFGAVGRIVRNADLDADFISQGLQVLLEDIVAGTIAAAAVAEDENGGGLRIKVTTIGVPPMAETIASKLGGVMASTYVHVADVADDIVQPVRDNDALGKAGEIVIQYPLFGLRIEASLTIEVAQVLFLFGIHTDDRIALCLICGSELGDVLELRIAIRYLALERLAFLSFAPPIAMLLQQLAHHFAAYLHAIIMGQRRDNFPFPQVRPPHLCIHRVSGGMLPQHAHKLFVQLGVGLPIGLASAARSPYPLCLQGEKRQSVSLLPDWITHSPLVPLSAPCADYNPTPARYSVARRVRVSTLPVLRTGGDLFHSNSRRIPAWWLLFLEGSFPLVPAAPTYDIGSSLPDFRSWAILPSAHLRILFSTHSLCRGKSRSQRTRKDAPHRERLYYADC